MPTSKYLVYNLFLAKKRGGPENFSELPLFRSFYLFYKIYKEDYFLCQIYQILTITGVACLFQFPEQPVVSIPVYAS